MTSLYSSFDHFSRFDFVLFIFWLDGGSSSSSSSSSSYYYYYYYYNSYFILKTIFYNHIAGFHPETWGNKKDNAINFLMLILINKEIQTSC